MKVCVHFRVYPIQNIDFLSFIFVVKQNKFFWFSLLVRCTQYNIIWYMQGIGLGLWCLTHFQQFFSYIVAVSVIAGGNRNTRRKPQTCHKSLTNFIM